MAEVVIRLNRPTLPNYLTLTGQPDNIYVDVATVPEDQLRALGAEWTEALVAHAAARWKNGAR